MVMQFPVLIYLKIGGTVRYRSEAGAERIYVCSQYGARYDYGPEVLERNVNRAIEIGQQIIRLGHIPLVPHLYHYMDMVDGKKFLDEEHWLEICCEWVLQCNSILVAPGWQTSHGMKTEHDLAAAYGRRIYYSIDEIEGRA